MTWADWSIVAAGAFLCYVMAVAVHDEAEIRDGIGLQNGVIQIYEAGRK